MLGNIGAHDHYQYTALGDIVNTASRIEGLNKYLGTRVLASEEVLYQLDGFLTRALGAFLPVGKTKPLVIYEVVCRREEANEQQRSLCTVFAEALAAYRQQAWDEALAKFHGIVHSSHFKDDGPTLLYIKLCEQYQSQSSWEILEWGRAHGGKIVQMQRVWSFVRLLLLLGLGASLLSPRMAVAVGCENWVAQVVSVQERSKPVDLTARSGNPCTCTIRSVLAT